MTRPAIRIASQQAVDPSYIEALDALGLALEALGHDQEAVATYQKAVELNTARHGTFASAHVNLSAYYNRTGDPDKALAFAQQALALEPQSDRALFQMARADERQGRLQDAVDALNRAIAINSRASRACTTWSRLTVSSTSPCSSSRAARCATSSSRKAASRAIGCCAT